MGNKDHHEPILLSIRDAARVIGIEQRQLREAIRDNLVPHYKLRNSIIMVKVSEVLSVMKHHKGEKSYD